MSLTRRYFLSTALAAPAALAANRDAAIAFLDGLRRSDGGFGWPADPHSHLTPTFHVLASYRVLGHEVPDKAAIARFVRENHPMPPARQKDRPLRRFDYEQIQALLWLGEDAGFRRDQARGWTGPSEYTRNYEHEGNPVFQHEVMALLSRGLLGIDEVTPEWVAYIEARRRPNGSFNSTAAEQGGDGHVINTWWGLLALKALGKKPEKVASLIAWIRACQLPSGGFTWKPKPELAAVDDAGYTWAAVRALDMLGAKPERDCAAWIDSLRNADGGYGDRPGRPSNPAATFYALDALAALGRKPSPSRRKPPAPKPLPPGLKLYTAQIEAPGAGSPTEAVEMARALRIHLWAAKNSAPGWIERCQEIADRKKVPVRFCVGNEEYGSYQRIPGLGTPSHLVDLVAPAGVDFGKPWNDPKKPALWQEFRDKRIAELRRAGGVMIWQFNENEELTRVLLDEAVETGTYAAVSSFHFGNENFLNTQPFLMRYQDVLPFVALQDAHTRESWWWGDQLAGFRTVYLARDASWNAWLEALRENRVMAIRHDAITGWETHLAGGTKEVRRRVAELESQWRWWGAKPDDIFVRPAASLVALRPGEPFEEGAPESGVALRLRLRHENTAMGGPKTPLVELVSMTVDGAPVKPELVDKPARRGGDRYYLYHVAAPGRHKAEARVRFIATGAETAVSVEF